jgi:hypothetical protein
MKNRLMMQKNILVYSLLLFGLILSSCQDKKLDKYLKEVRKTYSYLDEKYEWKIIKHYNVPQHEEFYYIKSIRKDTLVELMFSRFHPLQKISELKLVKSFIKNKNCHRLIIRDNDTVVYLITENPNLNKFDITKEKILLFKKGGYKQQYENGLLTKEQSRFYKFHKDSLDIIKGKDLLPLPDI